MTFNIDWLREVYPPFLYADLLIIERKIKPVIVLNSFMV
jgi:hypothetical protein